MSEGAPRHTSVVTVTARDPEGDTVTYSIVSGNNQQHFSIGESTGVVRVMQPLDREETNRYSLVSQNITNSSHLKSEWSSRRDNKGLQSDIVTQSSQD